MQHINSCLNENATRIILEDLNQLLRKQTFMLHVYQRFVHRLCINDALWFNSSLALPPQITRLCALAYLHSIYCILNDLSICKWVMANMIDVHLKISYRTVYPLIDQIHFCFNFKLRAVTSCAIHWLYEQNFAHHFPSIQILT